MAGSSMAVECSLAAVWTWFLSALLRDPPSSSSCPGLVARPSWPSSFELWETRDLLSHS